MNKLESLESGQQQIALLQTKIAALEEENRLLRTATIGPMRDSAVAERADLLFRSGYYEWDEGADRCVRCSDGMAELFGQPADRLTETLTTSGAFLELIHPDDREPYSGHLSQLRLRNSRSETVYRLQVPDRDDVFVREIREPVLDDYDRLVRSRGFVCDVTELHLARVNMCQAEQRFRHFADGATHFLWEMGPDLRYKFVSDGIRWVTGEDPTDFIGKTRREIAGKLPIDPQALKTNLDQMERREPFTGFLIERPRMTGGTVHLSISGSPLFGENNEFLGYRGTAHDVTDSRTSLQALDRSRTKYRDLVEGSIQGIFVTVDWKPVFANQACAEIFGLASVDRFLALDSVGALLPADDRPRLKAMRDARLRGEPVPTKHALRCLRTDGSMIWVESINRVVDWEGAKALQTTVIDITERKLAEDALRESEARLRAIMDHAPAEIFLKDEEGRYLEVNRHFEQLWNVRREDVRGKLPADIDNRGDYAESARQHDLTVLQEQRMIQHEDVVETAAGRQCLHSTKFPIRDPKGHVTGLGAIVINASDRWAAEENLRKAHDQLEAKVKDRTAELERLNGALKDSKARLSDAIESISDGFILFDADEKVVLCNSQYRKMFSDVPGDLAVGTTLEELVRIAGEKGLTSGKIGSVDDWVIKRLSEYRTKPEISFEQQLPDGRWTLANVRRTAEGGLVCIRTDITERKNAAMALAESEDRLRQAAELAGIGYCIWDSLADKCLYCSEEYARIHGTTVQGYLAAAKPAVSDCPFTHPDDREAYRHATENLRREGRGFGLEYRLIRASGDTRHVRTIVKPVFDEYGDVIQEYLTIQDITAQKETEIALRNNQDLLMAIIDHAPAEVDVKDADGKFVLINRQMEGLFGAPREQVVGKTAKDFFGPEAVKICNADDERVLQTGEEITGEKTRSVNGSDRTFVSVKFKIPQIAGGGAAVGRIATDITELKQQEKALRDHQEILETIMNSAPVSITVKDPQSRYIYVNPNELRAFGVEDRNYVGKRPEEMVSSDIADHILTLDRQVVDTGEPLTQYEERLPDGNNRLRHWLSAKVPVVVDGKVRFIVTTSLDVTEAKERERQLRQAQKMEAVGRLTGGIAHDFNNLLAVINGNLLFLRRKGTHGPELEQYLDAIETAAGMGTSLTSELLAFARPRELAPVSVDLPDLVDGMIKSLFRALPDGIEISTDFPADLWPILTDPQQLQNALFNLVLNARDAMPDGGRLAIEARNRQSVPDIAGTDGETWVEIALSDTGCGMTPDQLEQIFEPFFTTKPTGTGTGLGLSMVHRFVELSGGHIRIASEVGRGTRITLFLPRADPLGGAPSRAGEFGESLERGSETILVAEDDAGVRLVAVQTLRELGYAVLEAADGEHALEMIRADSSVALLFSDIELGGELDGYGLAAKAQALRPDLRVLFCSGYAAGDVEEPDRGDGDPHLIRKPYRLGELAHLIREVLMTER